MMLFSCARVQICKQYRENFPALDYEDQFFSSVGRIGQLVYSVRVLLLLTRLRWFKVSTNYLTMIQSMRS